MINAFATIGFFLVNVLFNIALFFLWLRFLFSVFRISSVHPFSRVIRQLTDILIAPINRLMKIKMQAGQYDWLCMGVIVVITLIKVLLLGLIAYGAVLPLRYLVLLTLADTVIQFLNVFFYLILIQAIMSWVNPQWHHPAAEIINILTQPLMRLGHRMIPNVSGFDFAPLILLILLTVLVLFIRTMVPLHLI